MSPSGGTRSRGTGLALLTVVSLALGIGAMSTAGSIVHAVLLRDLPFASPERLWVIGEAQASNPEIWRSSSYADFLDWQSQGHGFQELAISRSWRPVLRQPAESLRIDGAEVSADFFRLLGVKPALGRLLGAADFVPGAEPAVVLSAQIWRQRFGGDPKLLGRPISLDGAPCVVVGVLPGQIALDEPVVTDKADLLKPLIVEPGSPFAGRGFRAMRVLGLLRRGVSGARATAEMRQIEQRLAVAYPETNREVRLHVEPLREVALGGSRPILLALLGAAALLLLIAAVNATNVRLVELSARRRELAVRSALGAGRLTLLRQLLQESLPLVGAAFLLSLLLTVWAWDTFLALLPASLVRLSGLALDGRVLAATGIVSLLALALVDLLPFLELTRLPLFTLLARGSARTGESAASRRGRNALVAAEIALSLALLIGAGLLVRSLFHLSRIDLGFRPERVLALDLDLGSPAYAEPAKAHGFLDTLVRELDGHPGVRSAGVIINLPLKEGGNMSTGVILRAKTPTPNTPASWQIDLNGVSPGTFSTLGIPLLRGRDFTPAEAGDDQHRVVILNAMAARRLWPGEEAVGKQVILDWMNPVPRQVVGVVGDLREVGPETAPHPEAFLPYPQIFFGSAHVVIHTAGDPRQMAGEVRRRVHGLDASLPLSSAVTLEQLAAARVANPATDARILAAFAATGLILAVIGVYGVTSFAVSQQRQELGVRIALGAQHRDVVRAILAQGLPWIVLGLGLGLSGGAILSRLLASTLFEVSPLDPWTFAVTPLLLFAVALWAGYLPARRAALVDPLSALTEG
jgi:putative ABC transport system permease protein